MDNMESVIHKHNAKIFKPMQENTNSACSYEKRMIAHLMENA